MEKLGTCTKCSKEIIRGKTGFARYKDGSFDCGPCIRAMNSQAIKLGPATNLKEEKQSTDKSELLTQVQQPQQDLT